MTIIIHKPIDYTTTQALELIGQNSGTQNLHPLDHLDRETEGLVVYTHAIEIQPLVSEYEVTIDQYLSRQAQSILAKGLVHDGHVIPGIELIEEKHKGKRSVVHLKSTQTTDIQIRILFETIGYHVIGIRRIRLGDFKLGVLSAGKWKKID